MAGEINSLTSKNLRDLSNSSALRKTKKSGSSGGTKGSQAAQSDTLDITSIASNLQELENRIMMMSVVDGQKVEAVQHQLATGSFVINPQSAADKMLAMEIDLA